MASKVTFFTFHITHVMKQPFECSKRISYPPTPSSMPDNAAEQSTIEQKILMNQTRSTRQAINYGSISRGDERVHSWLNSIIASAGFLIVVKPLSLAHPAKTRGSRFFVANITYLQIDIEQSYIFLKLLLLFFSVFLTKIT